MHGSEARNKEKARLRRGVTVLVCTPGRLLDHLQHTEAFRTADLRWLVLDDVDQLLQTDAKDQLGTASPTISLEASAAVVYQTMLPKAKPGMAYLWLGSFIQPCQAHRFQEQTLPLARLSVIILKLSLDRKLRRPDVCEMHLLVHGLNLPVAVLRNSFLLDRVS